MAIQEDLMQLTTHLSEDSMNTQRKLIGLPCLIYRLINENSVYNDHSQEYCYEIKPYIADRFIVKGLMTNSPRNYDNENYVSLLTESDTEIIFPPSYREIVERNSRVDVYYGENRFSYKIQKLTTVMGINNEIIVMKGRLDPIT